jgi:hypothetical protein
MAFKGALQTVQDAIVAPHGKVIYVDGTNGLATGSGLTPDSAVTTLALGLAKSAANDIISIAPGTYTVDISTNPIIPLANQTWMAGTPAYGGYPNVTIIADADDTAVSLFAIDVSGVVFKDLRFEMKASAATHVSLIDAAQTTAVNGLAFIDCYFDLADQDDAGLMGLKFDDATNAITGLVIRGCRFVGNDATTTAAVPYISVGIGGIPYALIENNVFCIESADGDSVGIAFADPGAANKCYGMTIRNNDFIGAADGGGDTVGIVFTAAMTDNEILGSIRNNYFPGCSANAITTDETSESVINNYVPDAAGGALVDVIA